MYAIRAVVALLPLVLILLVLLTSPALPQQSTHRVCERSGSFWGDVQDSRSHESR